MTRRLKVMTIVGTRPEIIRLSRVMAALDRETDHLIVHTGQNYDYELNGILPIVSPAPPPARRSARSSSPPTRCSRKPGPMPCWCWATPTPASR